MHDIVVTYVIDSNYIDSDPEIVSKTLGVEMDNLDQQKDNLDKIKENLLSHERQVTLFCNNGVNTITTFWKGFNQYLISARIFDTELEFHTG